MGIKTFSVEWEQAMEEAFGHDLYRELVACGDVLSEHFGNNVSKMARELEMSQSTLYRTFNPDLETKPETLKKRLFRVAQKLQQAGYEFDQFKRDDMPEWEARLAPPDHDFTGESRVSGPSPGGEEVRSLQMEVARLRAKVETLKEVIADMDVRRTREDHVHAHSHK